MTEPIKKPRGRNGARPAKIAPGEGTVQVGARVPVSVADAIKARAKAESTTPAEIVRGVLAREFGS